MKKPDMGLVKKFVKVLGNTVFFSSFAIEVFRQAFPYVLFYGFFAILFFFLSLGSIKDFIYYIPEKQLKWYLRAKKWLEWHL